MLELVIVQAFSELTWQTLVAGTGELLHSLPLAPCGHLHTTLRAMSNLRRQWGHLHYSESCLTLDINGQDPN